jgi:hypothetical protein
MTLRRSLLPMLLVVLGIWLLAGCIYIPMFGRTVSGTNVSGKVGEPDSHKPIRIARTNRDQVIHLLGPPYAEKRDGTAIAYVWTVQNGIAVWPLCFTIQTVDGRRVLILRFDEYGVLQRSQILKHDDTADMLSARERRLPLPGDFHDAQYPEQSAPQPPRGPQYRTKEGLR